MMDPFELNLINKPMVRNNGDKNIIRKKDKEKSKNLFINL